MAEPFLVQHQSAVRVSVLKRSPVLLLDSDCIGLCDIAAVGRCQRKSALAGTMSAEFIELDTGILFIPIIHLIHCGDVIIFPRAVSLECNIKIRNISIGRSYIGQDSGSLGGLKRRCTCSDNLCIA